MSTKKGDENRDEDLKDEDSEAAEAEDTDSDSDAEDEEESKDDSEDDADEDESEDKSDDEDEEEGDDDKSDEDEGDEADKGKKGKFTMPDKFKGKSAEEIAEAYKNLEGMIGEKALEMAQNFLTKKGIKAKPEDGKDGKDGKKDDEEFDIGLSDEEISKMSPKEFARHLNRKITEKATEIAKNAIERSNEVKTNVSREIREATKAHPHLKENKEYREIVLSIIEASNAKGKVVTLKEACEKADKAMGLKPGAKKDDAGDDDDKPKKKPKTAVEKQDGGDGKAPKSDLDRVKEGMMNAGSSGGMLGGLGV